ncbi:MAG: hypothetical protein KY392_05740 [Chloroflexi bacterium]|nr:hypothetical protein [Chloroflexota bacterium]
MNASTPLLAPTPGWWRLLLAGLLATTGVIHLGMTPAHFGESTVMGVGFVAAGLLQLSLSALVVLRPRPILYLAVALASAALVGLYLVNVAVGLPWATSGSPHEVAPQGGSAAAHDEHETHAHHVDGDSDHHAADDVGDSNAPAAQPSRSHGHSGIQLGSGEPIDAIGGANLAVEVTSAGLSLALLRLRRR